MAEPSGYARYAELRVKGEIWLSPGDGQSTLIATLRRMAGYDGLVIKQAKHRAPQGRPARRQDTITVSLVHPDRPTDIFAPDAQEEP